MSPAVRSNVEIAKVVGYQGPVSGFDTFAAIDRFVIP